ncbi:MAG TPA: methyltransferase domain-containing protein [Gammaproteobacteria bacterium]|nr:methyltransferase domain-containing protein [Gammaproteobacteria bacterium]
MSNTSTREKWDQRYLDADLPGDPAEVLSENQHLLPVGGTALDLACGLGANALLLAEHGLDTLAWDISPVAVEKLGAIAHRRGLPLRAESKDLSTCILPPARFDVIVVAHYLERPLIPAIIDALTVGGLLFFQTFTRTALSDAGPKIPEWRLADGELWYLFQPLRPVVYREEGLLGDTRRGFRDKAQLVAIKDPGPRAMGCVKDRTD